jgi:hypothetical protein
MAQLALFCFCALIFLGTSASGAEIACAQNQTACDDQNPQTFDDKCVDNICVGTCVDSRVLVNGSCVVLCLPLSNPANAVTIDCPSSSVRMRKVGRFEER